MGGLIYIEGVDRTGKSTLAEVLTERHKESRVMHFGPPKKDALQEYIEPLLDYEPGSSERVVCDRLHVGEAVWPELFDREPRMTDEQRKYIELFLLSRGALAVHAVREPESLREAFETADPPEPLPIGDLDVAVKRFEEEVARLACPKVVYDQERAAECIQRIIGTSTRLSELVAPGWKTSQRWIGTHRPAVFVVCDPDPDLADLPLVEEFWSELLDGLGEQYWKHIAVASCASSEGKPEPLRDLWSYLGRPKIAAYGEQAHDVLRDQRLAPA